MNLKKLLHAVGRCKVSGAVDIPIRGIAYDSRKVKKDYLFVAISGFKNDGRIFIPQAVANGATAVVFEGKFFDKLRATQIRVSGVEALSLETMSLRGALARLSSAFFAHPTETFYLSGVTGTNGKTTLSYLMEALWQTSGMKTGVLGTVNYRYGTTVSPAAQTTPESRDLQELFAKMRGAHIGRVCMEVSSHALALERVCESQFDSAVFTNLSQDHLDFHGDMESYFQSKELLFVEHLLKSRKQNKLAVISVKDKFGKRLFKKMKHLKIPCAAYGFEKNLNIFPVSFKLGLDGLMAKLKNKKEEIDITCKTIGKFNLLNCMAAILVGLHSGLTVSEIQRGFKNFGGVPGRLEKIGVPPGKMVFVDYAHTPDALKNVLQTLHELTPKRLITVFGCGGDRDKSKRPLMGLQAAHFSQVCIVTSDNPRTENADDIIRQIIPGIKRGGLAPFHRSRGFMVEPDRRLAIGLALEIAKKGDIVLVCGKGHEDYQILGTKKIPFSDQAVIREFI